MGGIENSGFLVQVGEEVERALKNFTPKVGPWWVILPSEAIFLIFTGCHVEVMWLLLHATIHVLTYI